MFWRATLGCLIHSLLIILVGALLGALLSVFAVRFLKLPEWTRWVFQGVATTLITLGVTNVMRTYARQVLPPQQPLPDRATLSETDEQLVDSIQLRISLIAIGGGALVGILGYIALPPLQYWVYGRAEGTRFVMFADPLVLLLLLFLFGVLLVGMLAEPLCAKIAGARWLAIRDIVYEPLGYALSRRLHGLWLTLMGLCVVIVILWFDSYARFTDEGVYINRFWSWREQFYPHSEVMVIAELTRYKNMTTGTIERYESPYYEVRFRDGTVFRTSGLRHRYDETAHQLIGWWSEKSGVPVREVTQGVDYF